MQLPKHLAEQVSDVSDFVVANGVKIQSAPKETNDVKRHCIPNGINGVSEYGVSNGLTEAMPNGTHNVNGHSTFNGVTGENGHSSSKVTNDVPPSGPEMLDALVVGAGFAGIYLLHQLRKRNIKAKIVEVASDLGGVWYWNRYPGARADTKYPLYALSLPEVYEDWSWESHYPDSAELRRYFAHVDKKLQIKKDTYFDTKVVEAEFNETTSLWTIACNTGKVFKTPFFIASIGFAAKRYIPNLEGLDTFKGQIHHSSFWPKEDINVRGKRVGVLGSGSTGIQITQEWAREIGDEGDLKMFQRTPNLCCPMNQIYLTEEEQSKDKLKYAEIFNKRWTTFGGFEHQFRDSKLSDATPEERQALFEELWQLGGFRFLMNNYSDMTTDLKANRHAYDFWRNKVLLRVKDQRNAELLAPAEPPHPFGAKRLALEVDLYEQFERPNVNVIDIKTHPIVRLDPEGIVTSDGTLHKLDVIAVATGFDGITGGLKDIKIKGRGGKFLTEKWENGTFTYLGMSCAQFPNFFFTFGPQAPTAFSNGPTCVELQGLWIAETIDHMRAQGLKTIEAKPEAEIAWKKLVNQYSAKGLRHYTASWWNGGNVPGKVQEPLNYAGGIPQYIKTIKEVQENGYRAFELQ